MERQTAGEGIESSVRAAASPFAYDDLLVADFLGVVAWLEASVTGSPSRLSAREVSEVRTAFLASAERLRDRPDAGTADANQTSSGVPTDQEVITSYSPYTQ